MNKQRAKEIVDSTVMINVTFQGIPVYIQQVDDREESARVFPLDQPEAEQTVSLDSLLEH